MVMTGKAFNRQQRARQFAQSPLHPVAHDRVADLPGDGHAVAQALPLVRTGEQHEAWTRDAQALVGGEKVRAVFDDRELGAAFAGVAQAESFLRPRARRALSTLRPPTVALRARKPWRRLRTRLLGWNVRFVDILTSNTKNNAARPWGGLTERAVS